MCNEGEMIIFGGVLYSHFNEQDEANYNYISIFYFKSNAVFKHANKC